MKKAVLLFLIVLMLGLTVGSASAIPFPPPPPFILPLPPPLVVIPGTYVYAAPEVEFGLFFFDGFWYRQYENRWYRSPRYDSGRWSYMRDRDVPMGMRHLPPDYRDRIRGGEHLRYDDVNHNWRSWKNSKRWERDPYWKGGGHGPSGGPGGPGGHGPAMPSGGHDKGGATMGGHGPSGPGPGGHDKMQGSHGGPEKGKGDHEKDNEHGGGGR